MTRKDKAPKQEKSHESAFKKRSKLRSTISCVVKLKQVLSYSLLYVRLGGRPFAWLAGRHV